jgi:hypothetical protein
MRFIRYALAAAVVAGGLVLIPVAASASTTLNCSVPPYLTCTEVDSPGTANIAVGVGLPSEVTTGEGQFCTQAYYSSDGVVDLSGNATEQSNPSDGADVRWRVWYNTVDNLADATDKPYKSEGDSVSSGPVTSGATTPEPGYFWGCVVNYDEGAPPVDFGITISQG